ncbi:hypothetical protein WMY93_031500 [Mugilogobius chulae]|uniref:Uncharacterized protein n=1 Tax=Mugilogobius chulae TaxID=88201 RepID=A0AAW0MEK9_9GOBI
MSSNFLPTPLSSILFEDKFHFSTRQSLPYARHKCFSSPKLHGEVDVWNVKAPDFSIRLYRTVSEPREKERKVLAAPVKDRKVKLPKVLPEIGRRKMETSKFNTFYRAPDADEAEMLFLDEDVSDFITTYDKDPGNLKIKLRTLDTLDPLQNTSPPSRVKLSITKMDTFRPAEPQWDPRLLLPVSPWPPKSASYTRHKRRRGAYTAFWSVWRTNLQEPGKSREHCRHHRNNIQTQTREEPERDEFQMKVLFFWTFYSSSQCDAPDEGYSKGSQGANAAYYDARHSSRGVKTSRCLCVCGGGPVVSCSCLAANQFEENRGAVLVEQEDAHTHFGSVLWGEKGSYYCCCC